MTHVTEKNLMQWRDFQSLFPISLRPLRTEEEYDQMVSVMNELIDTYQGDTRSPAGQLLDLVALLVQQYEEQHPFIDLSDLQPHDILRTLMEEQGHTQKEAEAATGISQAILSQLINGKRDMNKDHIKRLSAFFKVDPSVFF